MTSAKPAYTSGTPDTLTNMLRHAVANAGDEVFLDIEGDTLTYAEFDRRSNRMSHALAELGVRKGEPVVSLTETHLDTLGIWFAIVKQGAIWIPINLAYRQEFLRHQIVDTGAKLVICDAAYLDRIVELADKLPSVKRILCRGADAPFPDCAIQIEPFENYRGTNDSPVEVDIKPSDLGALLYTSGTTGPSKGCMMSHNYLCMVGRQQTRALAHGRGDITWTCLPLFHAAALIAVLGALDQGLRIAIWPRFSVSSFWDNIEQSGANRAILMATIFSLVARAPETSAMKRCFGQLKMVFGVPISPEIRKIWQTRFGVEVVSSWSYGQTEVTRLAMVRPDEQPPELSAGRAADEFELMIFDEEDQPVPPGVVGQIVCRPLQPNVMFEGYWNRPDATAAVWRNLWMHTGDLGSLDENGYLYFVDRAKDYLRSRGENVSSFEVEKTLLNNEHVAEVAVHAASMKAEEDDIKATITLKQGAALTEHELCLWSIENLPHFAVPRYFEFRAELIKNPTGRVLKYKLREEGITSTTWDREKAGVQIRRR